MGQLEKGDLFVMVNPVSQMSLCLRLHHGVRPGHIESDESILIATESRLPVVSRDLVSGKSMAERE